jgi:hypothetical protein
VTLKKTTRVSVLLLILVVVCVTVSAAPALTSRWKTSDQEIKIDGLINDWSELLAFDENIAVAAVNDDRNLYLAITARDQQRRRQLLAAGVIVWLDAKGGKKKSWGIRIPGAGFRRPGGRPGSGANGDPDIQRPGEQSQPELTYVELLGPGKDDRRRIELSGQSMIAAGAALETDILLYELKIPLTAGPDAFVPVPGRPVGLGIHTPKLERPERGQREGGRGGGMGGRRGGMGGRGGGRGGGGGAGRGMRGAGADGMKELKVWTKLTLAQALRGE